MGDRLQFIAKILLLSWLLSLGIKYGGQWLHPQPTAIAAIVSILTPTIVCSILLGWRRRSPSSS